MVPNSTSPKAEPAPLTVWRLSDRKRGHDNQSRGLAQAISRLRAATICDLDTPSPIAAFLQFLSGRFASGGGLPRPDLIVGAGHGTHWPMLAARRAYGGHAIVLMKPSLPLRCFDLCLIPRHDGVAEGGNVIVTDGALNTVTPASELDDKQGLILVGGVSRHYAWDNDAVLAQVRAVLKHDTTTSWLITDSRRTPAAASAALAGLQGGNIRRFVSCGETDPDWLPLQLKRCGKVWVTEDSISMVYEALTAGAAVGLIDVPIAKVNRISHAVRRLVEARYVTTLVDWMAGARLKPSREPLREADRCAAVVLKRFGL